ncbi:MAG: PAS domain S-box protein [Ignavibacteriaceae bacterium]
MPNVYKKFFDESIDYLCLAGFDGYFKRINIAFEKLLGLNTDEILAKPFVDFIHPDDISKTLIEIDKLSKGSLTVNFENRFRNADGDYRNLHWTAYPDLELKQIFAIARDYTEKVKSDNILQIAIEASPVAMAIVNSTGTIDLVNKETESLFGYNRKDLVGKPIDILIPIPNRTNHKGHMNNFMKNPEARKMGLGRDLTGLRKDGSEFSIEIALNPVDNFGEKLVIAAILDITERKQAEAALIKSEEKYRSIFETIIDVYAEIDIKTGIIKEISPSVLNIVGYDREEILGTPFSSYSLNSDFVDELIKNAIEFDRVSDFEISLKHKNGNLIHCSISVRLVRDRNGKADKLVGTMRDVTERKKTLNQVVRSEQNQRIINYFATSLTGSNSVNEILRDITNICISKMDFEDCVIYLVNDDRTKLIQSAAYGSNKEQNYQILNPIEIPMGEGLVGSVARNGKSEIIDDVTLDERYIRDDAARGSEITIPVVYENKVIGIIDSEHSQKYFYKEYHLQILEAIASLAANKIMLTISLQKTRESEKKLNAVLSTVGQGIITINENSEIVMANEEVEKIWGYSRDELIGADIVKLMPPHFRKNHHAGMKRYKETRVPNVLGKKLELEGLRKDGSLFPIELTIMETIIENKLFFTAAVHDISERKTLIQKLKQSNDALSEFANIASHDLREPLRKISSFGSILKETLTDKMDEDDRENLYFMIDGAKRMQQMIDDLLSYSRLTSQVIALQEINLDEVFSDLIDFELATLIEESQAKIILEAPLGIVRGGPTQVKQLFQNLINNAIKYRKLNTIPMIRLRSQKQQKMIRIEIEDNGIGINPSYHSKIFEMFKRLHNRTQYSGSGIGLSICKKIVAIHEGEIGVESEEGRGSKFWVTLLDAEVSTIDTS